MKIMELWMTLDDLDRENTKCNYKGRDGDSLVKKFQILAAIWIDILLLSSDRQT